MRYSHEQWQDVVVNCPATYNLSGGDVEPKTHAPTTVLKRDCFNTENYADAVGHVYMDNLSLNCLNEAFYIWKWGYTSE